MEIPISEDLESICFSIMVKNLTALQWREHESTNMFQNDSFSAGFSAQENMFCFSYFSENDIEYWFQLSLFDVVQIAKGREMQIVGYSSEWGCQRIGQGLPSYEVTPWPMPLNRLGLIGITGKLI